jgi:GTP-binding protein HflX
LHVVDASNPGFVEQIAEVQRVLTEIGANDVPQLLVFNKIDAIAPESQPIKMMDDFEVEGVQTPRIFVSARNLTGLPLLREKLGKIVAENTDVATASSNPEPSGDDL